MERTLGFHFDASACIGCKACQIACKDKNDLPVGVNWRRVAEYGGGAWRPEGGLQVPVGVFAYHVSISCMHCENPACLPACPAGAITKQPDGAVIVNRNHCLGCHYCEWACPYGAPQFGSGATMSKCDFCADLRGIGQNPVCVDACPVRALHWGDLVDLEELPGTTRSAEPLPEPGQTDPSFVLTPHRHAQPSGQGTGTVVRMPGTKGKVGR